MGLIIEEERCKGCLLCAASCPRKILAVSEKSNSMGYHPISLTVEEKCISCGLCAIMCPDTVIQVS